MFLIQWYLKVHSYIDFYAHSCLKPFSTRSEAMFKQQNPCLNHEIQVPFPVWTWVLTKICQQHWSMRCDVTVFRRNSVKCW